MVFVALFISMIHWVSDKTFWTSMLC